MQVLISSVRPVAAFTTKSGSAKNARASDTKSACPCSRISSATEGILMRFEATTGIETTFLSRAAANAKAARGTLVAMVGTTDSCQPIPVFSASAPACSSACASRSISSPVKPPSTKSIAEIRYMINKPEPTRSRVRRTTSTGNRILFSSEPPHSSSRLLVRKAVN